MRVAKQGRAKERRAISSSYLSAESRTSCKARKPYFMLFVSGYYKAPHVGMGETLSAESLPFAGHANPAIVFVIAAIRR